MQNISAGSFCVNHEPSRKAFLLGEKCDIEPRGAVFKERKGQSMEEFRVIDNCLMIRLPEEVDHHRSAHIGEMADRFILNKEVRHVVFDFGDTRFMDSSGIGIIVGRYKKISCFGGKVYIIHADKQIRRIIRMSGLEQIAEILERQEK